jgi:Ni,Fe-hydrogenase III large subunit
MKEKFYIHNTSSFPLEQVPLLNEDSFQQKIREGCRSGTRIVDLFGWQQQEGVRICAVLGEDHEGKLSIVSMMVSRDQPRFESLTPFLAQEHMFEREIAEQFGITPVGHPWLKPVRHHPTQGHPFFQMQGEEVHEVAVGPVHAGIIEPGHFRFQCHGEEILNLEIQLGYQHRGIEKMMEEVSADRAVLLAESIAGDTVIGHTTAYCQAMESLCDIEPAPRSQALRAISLELERLSNHVGDLGALSTDIGFLPAAAYFGRLRGEFLNLLMEVSGNRYARSLLRPGGVLFDMDTDMIKNFHKRLLIAQKDLKEIAGFFFGKSSVLSRLEETGIVSNKVAKELGLVAPTARASGCGLDVRSDYAFGMYRFSNIPVSTASSGDVYARALVRSLESQRSIEFLLETLHQIPIGDLHAALPALKPDHMSVAMAEGWRGEIVHVVLTDANSRIKRYKIKDPSFHNWTALEMAVRGTAISDFPLCNKSFNLSYAGHDL